MILHHSSAGRSDRIGSDRFVLTNCVLCCVQTCGRCSASTRLAPQKATPAATRWPRAPTPRRAPRAPRRPAVGVRRRAGRPTATRSPYASSHAARASARADTSCSTACASVRYGSSTSLTSLYFTLLHFTSRPLHSTPPDEMTLVTLRRLRRVEKICIRMCTCARD